MVSLKDNLELCTGFDEEADEMPYLKWNPLKGLDSSVVREGFNGEFMKMNALIKWKSTSRT